MLWPDDDRNAKKPRYSAETGSKLVVTKDNDLQNVKNDLEKLKQTLEETRLELNETVNKLRIETTRNTELEGHLRQKKEELNQERLSRENLEGELEAAGQKSKLAEQEQKHLLQQLSGLSSQPNTSEQQRRIINLEKTVSSLRAENSRLMAATERPPSRTSAIPVSKNRRPRSSSETRSPQMEEELRTCRAELADAHKKCKAMETRMRKAETDSISLSNEKTAAERKAKSTIDELESALQEAKEELNTFRSEAQFNGKQKTDSAEQERLRRERASALEQLENFKADKLDLERKLSRKTAQCETLQEKLDDYMFSSEDEELRLELATAKEDARRANEQLSLFKERMQDFADRRESLARTRDVLQDRERQIRTLQEQLDRRESTSAALDQQGNRVIQLMHDREDVKDALAKSDARNRYVESQLQFRQHEMDVLRSQLKDCEMALAKSRSFNTQQQELYSQLVQSCNDAEARAQAVERELQELRDEISNRSTISEAAERNRQWREALERVETLESELEQRNVEELDPFRASTYQPPPGGFIEQPDADAVARLVLGLQRIRDERDVLRGSVEFLNLELRAKDAAYEQRLAAERSNSLRILQSAEDDIRLLSEGRILDHARIEELEALQDDVEASHTLRQSQLLSMTALVALQHAHSELDQERSMTVNSIAELEMRLQEECQAHAAAAENLQTRFETTHDAYVEITRKHDEVSRKHQAKCREVTNLESTITDLENEKTRLRDALDEQTAATKNLERECTAQMNDLKRLEEAHTIAREELYEAREEADQLRSNHMSSLERDDPEALAALQRHIEELDQRIIRRNEQIGVHQNDNRRLEMNLRIAENAVDEMRKELEELRNQRVWLEEDAATVRQERNLAEKELETARCELDTLKSSIDANDRSMRAVEDAHSEEVGALVGVVFDVVLQNRKSRAALHTLKSSNLSSMANTVKTVAVEDPMLLQRLETQSKELDEARGTIQTLTSDLEAKIEAFDQATRQMDSLKGALSDATIRGDTLATQLRRSTELAQDEVREQMEALEAEVDALSSEVESLEERLAEGQQQIKEIIDQNGELENQLTDLVTDHNAATKEQREKIAHLEDQASELQSRLDQTHSQSQEEVEALKEELEAAQADLTKSMETAESLESQVTILEQDNGNLSSQLTQVKSDLTGKVTEIADLSRRLAEAEEINAELEQLKATLQEEQEKYSKKTQEVLELQNKVEQIQQSLEQGFATVQRCQEERNDALKRLEAIPQLQGKVNQLQAANARIEKELQEAQQAASAAASTTVRDADSNIRIVQLETIISSMREENEELERVLTIKTKEIDEHDDRLIEVMKDRKKLVAKVDSLNRKVRNIQRQLDAATGVVLTDAAQDSEANEEHPPSVSLAIPTSTSKKTQTPTPSTPQFESPIHMLNRATGYRPSRSSLPDSTLQEPVHVISPRPLSSSAPPIPPAATTTPFLMKTANAATTPSTALGMIEMPTSSSRLTSTTQSVPFTQITQTPTPAATVITTPPSRGSSGSSRKRRLPDDFDPCPGEQLPAMPVLSTSPARLRKALREGAPLRTGFTPSRSRKSSAAAPDKELAKIAAAAAASLNLSGTTVAAPNLETALSTPAPLTAKSSQTSLRTRSSNDQGLRELKARPVADITNAPKPGRVPGSSATLQSDYAKPPRDISAIDRVKSSITSLATPNSANPAITSSAPSATSVTGSSGPAPRYRGGWLNRTAKPGGKSSSSTSSSRRPPSPTLGSVALPKSVTGEHRLLSRGLHSNS